MTNRALAWGPALVVAVHGLSIGPRFDRFVLPAFDGHVYAAMAESPRIFTLAPWGYRILMPFLVHLFPFGSAAEGYYWLNIFLLSGAVWAVGYWLRQLGFGPGAAALAGLALAVSPPLTGLLEYQVLVDPLALLIFVLILNELMSPRLLVLAGLFALGAITKEICLMPLTLTPLLRGREAGAKRGLLDTVAVGGPAIALVVTLRATWGHAEPAHGLALLRLAMERAAESWAPLASAAAVSGLALVALIGFFRTRSFDLRVIGGLMWVLTFVASVFNPYEFSVSDLPRLAVFAWPGLLPLALCGLGFSRGSPLAGSPTRPVGLWAGAPLLFAAGIVLSVDSYRRAPIEASTNPVIFLARNRESIKMAQSLDRGDAFAFDARSGRFAEPLRETFNLTEGRRQRFFLQAGFGKDAALSSGPPEFQNKAELLLPVMTARDATLTCLFEGETGAAADISVNGRHVGTARIGSPGAYVVPGSFLFRGENIIILASRGTSPIRLMHWEVHLAGAAGPPATPPATP